VTDKPDLIEEELDACVIVCQGPPVCMLEGWDAVEAQQKGCVWCKRIICHEDGSETVIEPSKA